MVKIPGGNIGASALDTLKGADKQGTKLAGKVGSFAGRAVKAVIKELNSDPISEMFDELAQEYQKDPKAFEDNPKLKHLVPYVKTRVKDRVVVHYIPMNAEARADRKDAKGKTDERHIESVKRRTIQSFKDKKVKKEYSTKTKKRGGVKGKLNADGIKHVRLDRIIQGDKKTVEHLSQLSFQAIANNEGKLLLERNPSINLQKLLSKEHSFDSLNSAQLKNIKETIEEFQLESFELDGFRASLSNQGITNNEIDAYIQNKINAYERSDSDTSKTVNQRMVPTDLLDKINARIDELSQA